VVAVLVNRPGELNELGIEFARLFTAANCILNVPQGLVHAAQLGGQALKSLSDEDRSVADRQQRLQLGLDVPQLLRILDPRGLDLQDRDLLD
jgi:hypothetical protein